MYASLCFGGLLPEQCYTIGRKNATPPCCLTLRRFSPASTSLFAADVQWYRYHIHRKFSWVYFSGLKRNKYDKIPKKYRDVIRKTASRVWRAVTRGGSQIWSKLSVIWFGCEKSKCFGFSKSCFVLLFEQHCLFWFDEPIRSTYDAFDKRRPILWKTT